MMKMMRGNVNHQERGRGVEQFLEEILLLLEKDLKKKIVNVRILYYIVAPNNALATDRCNFLNPSNSSR